jgi:NAD(P)-dependent dehydrogenase (short-subunit alcohol dehydrogenase family)
MRDNPFQDGLLAGRVALVTGGATGIGHAITRRLAQLGATVTIASRNPAALQEASDGFARDDGLTVAWKRLDVREDAQVKMVIDDIAEANGGLDILINNAAGNFICPTAELSPNGWRAVIDIDLNGTFYCCRHAYPHLKAAAHGGRIISISTTRANSGWPGAAHAGAAKAGIQSLMRALAVEWGPDNIRSNFISPGPIAGTVGVQKLYEDQGRSEEMRAQTPIGRFGEAVEIANAVAYLASPAGDYISGAELAIDGARQWNFGV